jgi:AraC-like DNA-binding protein
MGYPADKILQAQAIPPQILNNPKLRIPILAFAKLLREIIAIMHDETCGLLDQPQPIGSTRLLALACLSSESIEQSLLTWRDGVNLLNNGFTAHIQQHENGSHFAIECTNKPGIHGHFALETSMVFLHRFHCWLAAEFLPITRVELAFPAPAHAEEYRFLFYGAPVIFNQKQNSLFFDRQVLETPCNRNRESLNRLLENVEIKLLTQTRQGTSLSMRIRLWMEKGLREGSYKTQLEEAAQHFGINPHTIRRHLKHNDITFKELKEETRRDVAMHLISEGKLSIEAISFQLGYSESSTFIRAFKQWTSLTPLQFRKMHKT